MGKVVGIDLGTTNSVVAVLEAGEPVAITTAEGGRLVPPVVAFAKNGERRVGQTAKRQTVVNPENMVFSIKRLMGRTERTNLHATGNLGDDLAEVEAVCRRSK